MSEKSDPFSAFESDRTVIKPSAGRGPRAPATAAAPTGAAPPEARAALDGSPLPELPGVAGFGPLLQAATPLLRAAPRIRAMVQHPNPGALRASLVEGVRRFEAEARAAGAANEHVVAARYTLCSLLDECASSTPWGGGGAWAAQSLLVLFHNEAWGGEKVFQLMGKLAEDVPRHRPLLEVISVALALGFEGRYKVIDNGRAQLEAVRERLAQMLRGAPVEPELSPHWRGVGARRERLRDGVPVWAVAAVAAFVLLLAFVGLRFALHERSDAPFAALAALDVAAAPPPLPPPPAPPPDLPPRLAAFLEPEVKAGLVEVRDFADRSVVTIRGDGFFEPGSADVADKVKPLLARIAAALDKAPGSVLVTGHTDNQPLRRSLRYPSNYELSQERAASVRSLLAAGVRPERLRAEGRADGEPVDDNATPAGRAHNRRVEITLFAPKGEVRS